MAKQLLEDTRAVSQHKMAIEAKLTDAQIRSMDRDYDEGRWGQVCAVLVVVIAVTGGVILGLNHAQLTGGVIGVAGLGTIVAHFIYGRKYGQKSGRQGEQSPEPRESSNPVRTVSK